MSPSDILTTITLAVSGWTLIKVIQQGEAIARITTRLDIAEHQRSEES